MIPSPEVTDGSAPDLDPPKSPRDTPAPDASGARGSWLPPRGFERTAFLVIAVLMLAFKALAIHNFRADSDETQHAHVVWSLVTGQLQYRDFFDNHMPLFHMAMVPFMAMLGERADIMIWLRAEMVPFFLLSAFAIYRITEILYSRRIAAWSALGAVTLPQFFYTSTEFRTDDSWAAIWLLALVVAISGKFTVRRALATGLLLGIGFAISVKTAPLIVAALTAAAIAIIFAVRKGVRMSIGGFFARNGAIIGGFVVAPAGIVLYYIHLYAWRIMYYCTIQHNIVPGLKRWGHFSLHQWYYPLSIPVLAAYAWLIFRQTPDVRLAIRRTVICLTPWFFYFILLSYWPDITREDDLPYVPLLPLSIVPLLLLAVPLLKTDKLKQNILTYGLPGVALVTLFITTRFHSVFQDRLWSTTNKIHDALILTKPDEYVMDNKGEYVYRQRAYYWVLEPLTKARLRMGLIHDAIPHDLIAKDVALTYLRCGKPGSIAAVFVTSNYIPFDPSPGDAGVLGKVIAWDPAVTKMPFEIVIPQTYAIASETGQTTGTLDGKPYTGPVPLAPGKHEFDRAGGGGRAAVILAEAVAKGFAPQFDADRVIIKEVGTLPKDKKRAEAQ